MSIFINGMQLPKDEVAVIIYSDGDVRTEDWTKYSAIEVPDETQPVKWIPVTERWPGQFKPVLVYYNRNGCSGMGVAEYYHDGDTKVWRGCGFIPTHWMPLPKPPKDGEP